MISNKRKKDLKQFLKNLRINFKDLHLLNLSLSHKSFVNENSSSNDNNEKLEFLGDSILGLIIAEYLFNNFGDLNEGDLARIKSFVVSEDTLSKLAKDIQLNNYILIGKGEELSGGRNKKTILADTFEALIAAYFLDTNLNKTKQFILKYFIKEIELVLQDRHEKDYKTLLQELAQKKFKICPSYTCYDEFGPEHDKTFCMEVKINNKIIGTGEGKSKKDAEKDAAKNAYLKLTSVSVQTQNKKRKKKNSETKNK